MLIVLDSSSSGTVRNDGSGFSERARITASSRRAQHRIGAIQFEAGRAAAGQAVVAEHVVLDAVEHPGEARVARGRQAAVVRALERRLAGEADAHQHLRRPAVAPPQSAQLAVGLVMKYSPGSAAQVRMPPSARRSSIRCGVALSRATRQ